MTNKTLEEILTGARSQTDRKALHDALDALLDEGDADGGDLDFVRFWQFVAELAQGRGIADGFEAYAAITVAKLCPPDSEPAEIWKQRQWAILFNLLKIFSAFDQDILPSNFLAPAFTGPAINAMRGSKRTGTRVVGYPDLLGLGTVRAGDAPMASLARRLLVGAVYYRSARDCISLENARAAILPNLPRRTWQDWQREVALATRNPVGSLGHGARLALLSGSDRLVYDLSQEKIDDLLKIGWLPNG
jgi:hypothetical protein